jgi:hypothetical protein
MKQDESCVKENHSMPDIFISYSHRQSDWVHKQLVPILRASQVTVAIDVEISTPGDPVPQQMGAAISDASIILLVLTDDYLASQYCQFEMKSALERRKRGDSLKVIGILRGDCNLPAPYSGFDSDLFVDLRDATVDSAWQALIRACEGSLGCSAAEWIEVRDRACELLMQRESVNAVLGPRVYTNPLVNSIRTEFPVPLGVVDLLDAETATQDGLLTVMWRAAFSESPPGRSHLLLDFQSRVRMSTGTFVVLKNFDEAKHRSRKYSLDLWSALKKLIVEDKVLMALVVSRAGIAQILPKESSLIDPRSLQAFVTVRVR